MALLALLVLAATGCAAGGGTSGNVPGGRPDAQADATAGGDAAPAEGASTPPDVPHPDPPRAAPDPRLGHDKAPPPAAPQQPPAAPDLPPAFNTVPPRVADTLVRGTGSSGRTVALTFDDGPSTEWTPQVLDLLDHYDAKATFCVVGEQAREHPDLLRTIVAKGHQLCDHSETHDERIARLPEAALKSQITLARDAILAAVPGVRIPWFRSPGGSWTATVRGTAASFGMKPLDWSVDSRDWERGGVDRIVATVKRELRPGGVVLMHDAGGNRAQTVAALKKLLPWLVAQGYSFDFPA
ncbi:polysaccharide deacetylase family protein [Yinghuangia sp. YIM S09857]|uniref:polysaccharide deacetylase family protein n=1 Tax=Yinghuangia sp. YIM S09857 TaxID=3436929 RepID=UPI003F52F6C8